MSSLVHETNNNPSDNPAINQNNKLTLIGKNGGVPDKIEFETKTLNIKRNMEEAHHSLEQQEKK